MAPLYRTERCFPSVTLKLLHRKFFHNLKIAAAHYYRQYYTGPSEHCAVAVRPGGIQPAETDQRCDVISFVTEWTGNPAGKPTVKAAGTLCLCCVLCNCMEYSAAWNVFIVENTESDGTSWFSDKVTAVALVNNLVLDLGMGLGLSRSNIIFVYIVQFR